MYLFYNLPSLSIESISPDELNFITLTNQKEMYSILFQSVLETLFELSRNIKYLGAEIGFTTILHTWGQNLMERILSDEGIELRINRSIQLEGAFTDVKGDMEFRRFLTRGNQNVLAENIF